MRPRPGGAGRCRDRDPKQCNGPPDSGGNSAVDRRAIPPAATVRGVTPAWSQRAGVDGCANTRAMYGAGGCGDATSRPGRPAAVHQRAPRSGSLASERDRRSGGEPRRSRAGAVRCPARSRRGRQGWTRARRQAERRQRPPPGRAQCRAGCKPECDGAWSYGAGCYHGDFDPRRAACGSHVENEGNHVFDISRTPGSGRTSPVIAYGRRVPVRRPRERR